jgi:ketosteroid isomerase-like protein
MSQDHAALVRRGFDAYNRGDVQESLETWAADAVWDWSKSLGPEAGIYRGRDEIRAFWEKYLSTFNEIRFELVEVVEMGDDQLVVDNVAHLQGRDGIMVQARSAWLITARDGQLAACTLYQTKEEALEAAGGRE